MLIIINYNHHEYRIDIEQEQQEDFRGLPILHL